MSEGLFAGALRAVEINDRADVGPFRPVPSQRRRAAHRTTVDRARRITLGRSMVSTLKTRPPRPGRTAICLMAVFALVSCSTASDVSVNTRAGTVFRGCADCPQMVIVPEGDVLVGSPENEPHR